IITQRIPQTYVVSFILPICFMVLLDIVSMFIEMPKNDRLGFKISIVLGFSMLLLILNDILPLSHTPPLLDAHYKMGKAKFQNLLEKIVSSRK
ncbi:unnamed protein product, partial [Ranitomeya imitator]